MSRTKAERQAAMLGSRGDPSRTLLCICTPIHCDMECPACGGPSAKTPCKAGNTAPKCPRCTSDYAGPVYCDAHRPKSSPCDCGFSVCCTCKQREANA